MSTVTLIPGDGIGPEVTHSAVRVLDAAGAGIEWERHDAGGGVVEKYGTPMPDPVIESIGRNKVALKGPITTPVGKGFASANVNVRKRLDLYANVRRAENIPGVPCRYENVKLVVVRENTEGLYSGIEHEVIPGVVESLKIITRRASERIARYAFKLAREEGWGKVTAVHKANIMKMSDGLFLDCCREEAARNPDIEYNEWIVDACSMQLVIDPTVFRVMVMENFYGDVISDLTAGLVGGLGVLAGLNVGDECAMFEAVHGSAPSIAGKNIANPTALILCGVGLLERLGKTAEASRVLKALYATLSAGEKTRDLGGSLGTHEFTDAVIRRLG